MYLNLGQDAVLHTKEIIGIFDLDSSTVVKNTRDYLFRAEKNGEAKTVSYDLPKSFVVCAVGKKDQKVYISQYSSMTLIKHTDLI